MKSSNAPIARTGHGNPADRAASISATAIAASASRRANRCLCSFIRCSSSTAVVPWPPIWDVKGAPASQSRIGLEQRVPEGSSTSKSTYCQFAYVKHFPLWEERRNSLADRFWRHVFSFCSIRLGCPSGRDAAYTHVMLEGPPDDRTWIGASLYGRSLP
jgi:hypothetical protein